MGAEDAAAEAAPKKANSEKAILAAGRAFRGVRLHLAGTPSRQVFGPQALGPAGHATAFLPVPSAASLLGRRIYLQAFVEDALGPAGLTATAALSTPILSAE